MHAGERRPTAVSDTCYIAVGVPSYAPPRAPPRRDQISATRACSALLIGLGRTRVAFRTDVPPLGLRHQLGERSIQRRHKARGRLWLQQRDREEDLRGLAA